MIRKIYEGRHQEIREQIYENSDKSNAFFAMLMLNRIAESHNQFVKDVMGRLERIEKATQHIISPDGSDFDLSGELEKTAQKHEI